MGVAAEEEPQELVVRAHVWRSTLPWGSNGCSSITAIACHAPSVVKAMPSIARVEPPWVRSAGRVLRLQEPVTSTGGPGTPGAPSN